LMYGGPYYSIVEADDDEEEPASDNFFPDATDHHLIKPNLKKMTGGK